MSVSTHRKRHGIPGPKREERLLAEAEQRQRLGERFLNARAVQAIRGSRRDAVGLKRWFVPGSEFGEGKGILTPYARKERTRRRAARRVAHESRRRRRNAC